MMDNTEGDVGVLAANIITLLIGEEHVGRETTLWGIGICDTVSINALMIKNQWRTLLLLLSAGTFGSTLGGLFLWHVDGCVGF